MHITFLLRALARGESSARRAGATARNIAAKSRAAPALAARRVSFVPYRLSVIGTGAADGRASRRTCHRRSAAALSYGVAPRPLRRGSQDDGRAAIGKHRQARAEYHDDAAE